MRIMITAGGTGGHIFPALILMQEFKKMKHQVTFVCRKTDRKKFSNRLNPVKAHIRYIDSVGIKRKFGLGFVLGFLKLFISLLQSYKIMKEIHPDVIIGFGGYLSFAPSFVGHFMGHKIVLIEQNSIPGLSNKIIYKFSDTVFLNYEYTKKWFPKGILLRNPVNPKIGTISKKIALPYFALSNKKKTIFILGGSQGAKAINQIILDNLDSFKNFNLLWSTGTIHYKSIQKQVKQYKNVVVKGFINKMEMAWAVADIVIARAGASTISEIKQASVPSILIPYPFATENHQYFNAIEIEKKKMGFVIEETELTIKKLYTKIEILLKKNRLYKTRMKKEKIENSNIAKIILETV